MTPYPVLISLLTIFHADNNGIKNIFNAFQFFNVESSPSPFIQFKKQAEIEMRR